MQNLTPSLSIPPQRTSLFITFKEGLIGYSHLKILNLSAFAHLNGHLVYLLQSFEYPGHSWVLIKADALHMSLTETREDHFYYILKPANHKTMEALEANLNAPLWIDLEKGQGVQKICEDYYDPVYIGTLKDFDVFLRYASGDAKHFSLWLFLYIKLYNFLRVRETFDSVER